MSISFNDTPNPLAKEFMEKMLGQAEFTDGKSFLYEDMAVVIQRQMKELANLAEQPVTVELHGEGEIKTMADGTQYQVTRLGWVKVGG
jgi:hypothetical protein